MNSYSVVQFCTLVVYSVLIIMVLRYARTKLKSLFVVYLAACIGWSLFSFLAHSDYTSEQARFWIKFVPFFASWSIVAWAHFISRFAGKGTRVIPRLGYGYLLILASLIFSGYIPRNVLDLGAATVYNDYGPWIYVMTGASAYLIGTAVFSLVKNYRASRSPEYRNRISYLLAGLGFLIVFGFFYMLLPQQEYALDHVGHLGNALILTYAVMRYQLLDVKLVIRRGLAYSAITVFITAVFLIVLSSLHYFLQSWSNPIHLGAIIVLSIIMAWLFNPLRAAIQKGVDRLFYGKRYDYRQTVRTFASRMSNVLDLKELAEAMLPPITGAVCAKQASLLLPDDKDFSTQFAERLVEGEPTTPIKLRKDSPIVTWLTREDKPLSRETIDIDPEFKGLWQTDRNTFNATEIELLCPIKSRHVLIGILALSKKQPHGFYSTDDIDMVMTLASEAAVVIENARLYAQAKERANTDELTGLFNHRYFHERIDEEIARCSRFGEIFSLIFLDLDLFKQHNDIYGHLAGDDTLRLVSQQIKLSIRRIDIGFRYGGDEFAVMLPQTPLEETRKVAERIRRAIETRIDTKGEPMTCSVGISSWPTDGVLREELVQATDAALYYAKQTGRNRTCLAHEVALSQVIRMETGTEDKSAILSTIYALASTVDAKDHYTYGHSKKVCQYATDIAEALGYSTDMMATIRAAALLHDIGKIGVSDEILAKAGPLSPDEWQPIQSHPDLGVAILKHVDALKDSLAGVQYHHERYDGTGYPTGLKGDNIPLDARILAVADSYDAMTSSRPYRPAKLTHEESVMELRRCAGTQFDPRIVDAFINLNLQPAKTETKARERTTAAGSESKITS